MELLAATLSKRGYEKVLAIVEGDEQLRAKTYLTNHVQSGMTLNHGTWVIDTPSRGHWGASPRPRELSRVRCRRAAGRTALNARAAVPRTSSSWRSTTAGSAERAMRAVSSPRKSEPFSRILRLVWTNG